MTSTPLRDDAQRSAHDDAAQRSRWSPGQRLHDVLGAALGQQPGRVALDLGDRRVTAGELLTRADVLATRLHRHGVRAGDRVALLLDRTVDSLPAMIAVSRLGAAYVPLDTGFPADRISYICTDAAVTAVLTTPALRKQTSRIVDAAVVDTGDHHEVVEQLPGLPPAGIDEPAYVIYTSGTTGRPKGVEVAHSSIVNFVLVAAGCYGYTGDDRVYQGMTVAFDFSVEETWVPLLAGATLVPRPVGGALVGDDLTDFVHERAISAICCVPTLLATLDEQRLPGLRLVIVSGEACPQDLVTRWARPTRRMLNVYGPTEATVTATWSVLDPNRPVTLGRPLPSYTVVLLDPGADAPAGAGRDGEIGIAGPGLALGYLDRPDLTARAFPPDFLELEGNPSGRIYRTGDLGRIDDDGLLHYLGRIDTQVKIRGYRIELTEVESVLLTVPGVAAAVVHTWEFAPGATDLVAYYTVRADAPPPTDETLTAALRERLPAYMVPVCFERLERIPLTTSDKVDRRALPAPAGRRVTGDLVAAATPTETLLAEALSQVLGLAEVSVTAHLIDELGANSLLLARLCAAARDSGATLSIRDVYEAPTLRALAGRLDTAVAVVAPAPAVVADRPAHRATTRAYVLTGVAQVLVGLAYAWLLALVAGAGYDLLDHTSGGSTVAGIVGLAAGGLVANTLLPVALKWLLVGRWRAGEIRLWSPAYLRFWVVRTAIRSSILGLAAGTPLHAGYLRLLGARIGRRALVLTRHLPVATDLISIGADAVVGRDALLAGYRAEAGRLRLGPIALGERAVVGENSVLDVDTAIGDDAELAPASSLHAGQRIPAGAVWHGSPAEPAGERISYRGDVPTAPPGHDRSRGVVAAVGQAVFLLLVAASFLGVDVALADPFARVSWWWGAALLVAVSGGVVLMTVVASFALAVLGARLGRLLRPGVVYPVHGWRRTLLRAVDLASNRPFLVSLFGDSELITGYQRRLGWQLGEIEQTGSNFGTTHRHDVPSLAAVGRGTMISDGLSMANVQWSSTGFRVGQVTIGDRNFLGNKIVFPLGAAVGDNVLLATKVLVPVGGPPRHDVGLLGSPAFEIPRSTGTAHVLDLPADELASRLRRKRRHNLASMALLMVVRWLELVLLGGLAALGVRFYRDLGALAPAIAAVLAIPLSVLLLGVAERAVRGGRPLRPRTCSISDPAFWRHERLWKLLTPYLAVLDGTPAKAWALRLVGVRVGRRLFDDGAAMPEHTLVSIGDDCTLGAGAVVQCHSLEDGTFTSDRTVLGDGVTLGAGAFVHYGVDLGDGVTVAPDAFVMKGSRAVAGARWHGNPAVPATH